MATTRTINMGSTANPKSGRFQLDLTLDSTQILASDGTVAGYAANDVFTGLLPAGTKFSEGMIYTDATWTGNIDIGTGVSAADSQDILNGGTPAAAGSAIACSALLNVTTTRIGPLATGTYLNITIKSANTTGKIRITLWGWTMNLGMAG